VNESTLDQVAKFRGGTPERFGAVAPNHASIRSDLNQEALNPLFIMFSLLLKERPKSTLF